MPRCHICFDLQKKDEDDPRLGSEFLPHELIEQAASFRCAICPPLLQGIQHFEDGVWDLKVDVRRICLYALGKEGDSLYLELYFKNDRPKLTLEFYTVADTPLLNGAIKPRTQVIGFPVLTLGVEWALRKIQTCSTEHKICSQTDDVPLPTRLLAFERTSSNGILVRLIDSRNQRGKYNALSYCWGQSQACITTKATIEEFKRGIPWSSLSLTCRDAIEFSIGLGVSLLWVDALAIVQDDNEDWDAEASRMADIYQNAYITLAATSSSDAAGGCFSNRMKPPAECKMVLPDPSNGQAEIMVRRMIRHWTTSYTKATAESFPLLSRGWAFQETYLSRRVVYFCSDELVWQCRTTSVCECGANSKQRLREDYMFESSKENSTFLNARIAVKSGVVHKAKETMTRVKDRLNNRQNSVSLQSQASTTIPLPVVPRKSISEQVTQWHDLITRYSALELTKEMDRLPALSGLALRMSSLLGTYYCGLWSSTLLTDLMWRVPWLESTPNRPSQYLGPTWSWASVKKPVQYWDDLPDYEADLEEILSRWAKWLNQKLGARLKSCRLDKDDYDHRRVILTHLTGDYEDTEESVLDTRWPRRVMWASTGFMAASKGSPTTSQVSEYDRLMKRLPRWQCLSVVASFKASLDQDRSRQWTWLNEAEQATPVFRRLRMLSDRSLDIKPTEMEPVVVLSGQNPFGEVLKASICLKGRLIRTRLVSNGPRQYELEVSGIFYPDYALDEGPHQLDNGAEVHLFLVQPHVCLVLKECPGEDTYERIGIVRESTSVFQVYGQDWMRGSVVRKITIM